MSAPPPPNSSALGHSLELTDQQLAAELRKYSGKGPTNHPVGELLARHWEAAFSYALLCTDGAHPAGMLTTAAFTRLFEEALTGSGPTAAWRPEVLVAVRRIAGEWAADQRREMLHPVLRSASGEGDGDGVAARLLPSETRRLVSRSFQRLGAPARCLLWHVDVEAEQLDEPAALLGLNPDDAAVKLERAREFLRSGCLDVHRELAPDQECRRYSRLLDVSLRRDDNVFDPDLHDHLAGCRHCRHAAEQLNHRDGRTAALLAEAVLGWSAWEYLDSRPGRGAPDVAAAPEAGGERTGSTAAAMRGGEPFAPAATDPFAPAVTDSFAPAVTDPFARAATAVFSPAVTDPFARAGTEAFASAGTEAFASAGAAAFAPTVVESGATEALAAVAAGRGGGSRALRNPRRRTGILGTARTGGGPETSSTAPRGEVPGDTDALRPAPPADAPRAGSRSAARRAQRRLRDRRHHLALAVLTVSASVFVPLALWAAPWSSGDGDGVAGAAGEGGTGKRAEPDASPTWVGAAEGDPNGTLRGRLRNADSGLCIGLDGKKPVTGAEAVLVPCSASADQQWAYETDGRLRSAAAPDLCLDSHLGYSVLLGACTGESQPGAKNVRYDFTLQGTFVPRWNQELALTPVSSDRDAALVLKARADDSDVQRWLTDASTDELQMESVNWQVISESRAPALRTSQPTRTPSPTATSPETTREPQPTATPSTPAPGYPSWDACDYVDCSGDGRGGSGSHGGGGRH
ncbi:ricin-type beta-trefoil lectin domain protein [Streptomyces sp. NPDC058371]|uniref:ricin-type beta-trefoil lectin domain protein n=1 Tax=Streptomyces sp. NPDC058371 TaxID=3346463 RepID=UPI003650A76D